MGERITNVNLNNNLSNVDSKNIGKTENNVEPMRGYVPGEDDKIESVDLDINTDIASLQDEIRENINEEKLKDAFENILLTKISSNSASAINENFIDSSNILENYWIDDELVFEEQENGAVLISQKDENGNLLPMGWTTKEACLEYLNYIKNYGTSSNNESIDENNLDTNKSVKENNSETNKSKDSLNDTGQVINAGSKIIEEGSELAKKVQDEIIVYLNIYNSITAFDYEKDKAYEKLSQDAKDVINNKAKILSSVKDLEYIIDTKRDIHIPKNMNLYIDGHLRVGTSGVTFKYDPTTSKYRIVDKNGNFTSATGFTRAELLASAEIK